MAGFRIPPSRSSTPDTPEDLFRDLNRDPRIPYLWLHQGEVLRKYVEYAEHQDVALELPTGAGKTLIGLLIAEWRRRKYGDRTLYLCPTRQLAHQVGEKAKQYGIDVAVLVGPGEDFPPEDLGDFHSARRVAVTTYSGLFNAHPRFEAPETLILDDAHAGENYIAGMWSLQISRHEYPEVYDRVASLFLDSLPYSYAQRVYQQERSPHAPQVDKVPTPVLWARREQLIDLLDEATLGKNQLWFPWQRLRDYLHACHLYIGIDGILLRPLLPPSLTHQPFAGARHRLYMSATLGVAGELERVIGVERIERIPVPQGWDTKGIGRRLVLFPCRSLSPAETDELCVMAILQRDRSLVLTPTWRETNKWIDLLQNRGVDLDILVASDVEETIQPFAESSHAALVLANRYDGLDLPDEICRLLILSGYPGNTNLQERFLSEQLRLSLVLEDRVLTRFTQALGRCCRGATDHCAVLVTDHRLLNLCSRRESQGALHPELQAEIAFGLENSPHEDPAEYLNLLRIFFEQGDGWRQADEWIKSERSRRAQEHRPETSSLAQAARLELRYNYALWNENFDDARQYAHQICELLSGDALAPYRAWWLYLLGSCRWLEGQLEASVETYQDARRAGAYIRWFSHVTRVARQVKGDNTSTPVMDDDAHLGVVSARIYEELTRVGTLGRRFEREMLQLTKLIGSDDSDSFENGLKKLGTFCGFAADRPGTDGAPDGIWILDDDLALVFEAKTGQQSGTIGRRDLTQTKEHVEWIRNKNLVRSDAQVIPVLISPRDTVDAHAEPFTSGVFVVHPRDVRDLARRLVTSLTQWRAEIHHLPPETAIPTLAERMKASSLNPRALLDRLCEQPAANLVAKQA